MRIGIRVGALLVAFASARLAYASGATDLTSEGRLALASGDEHRAVRLFTDAITLDPSLGDAYVALAQARVKLGDAREAERVLTAGLIHAPNHDALYEARAKARRALGWHADAVVDMHEYATRIGTIEVWQAYATFCGEGGQFPAQLGAWRKLATLGEQMKQPKLQEKARRLAYALQLLVDHADPVLTPSLLDPSRQALAAFARRRLQSRAGSSKDGRPKPGK